MHNAAKAGGGDAGGGHGVPAGGGGELLVELGLCGGVGGLVSVSRGMGGCGVRDVRIRWWGCRW